MTNDLVIVNLPAPVSGVAVKRCRYTLFPAEHVPVGSGTALLQVPDAQAALVELDGQLQRMSRQEAETLAEQLLGYFPNTAVHSDNRTKAIFLTGLMETLLEHSAVVGLSAVMWIKGNRDFLNQADLVQACTKQTQELRTARAIAQAHLDEHAKRAYDRRDMSRFEDKANTEEVARVLGQLGARLKAKSKPRRIAAADETDDEFNARIQRESDAAAARVQAHYDRHNRGPEPRG